jgi:hypothetical protein
MGYSLENYKNAKEALSPEKMEQLREFRDLKSRWEAIKNSQSTDAIGKALDAWDFLRGKVVPMLDYKMHKQTRHQMLEHEFEEETKEGQMNMAHEEAGFFNEAYNLRENRLRQAEANKNTAPDEYSAALASFDELVADLKESDLRKYWFVLAERQDSKRSGADIPSDLSLEGEEVRKNEKFATRDHDEPGPGGAVLDF